MALYPNALMAVKAAFPGREVRELGNNKFMVAIAKVRPIKFRFQPWGFDSGTFDMDEYFGPFKDAMLLEYPDGHKAIDISGRIYDVIDNDGYPYEVLGRSIVVKFLD